jgi:hypothetical protein
MTTDKEPGQNAENWLCFAKTKKEKAEGRKENSLNIGSYQELR